MQSLIWSLDYYLKACTNTEEHTSKLAFFNQAFGACQYHIILFPAQQSEVEELWNCYKPQFEEIVYGV